MRNNANSGLESVLEKLSRSLADRFGINLICQGDKCCTDGKNIYLPSLPDDIPKELLRAIHGWVDHECAHLCEHTDMQVAKEFRERFGPLGFFLLNILEDLRVEEGMRRRFPGSCYNLARCYEFAIAEAAKEGDMHPMRQLAFAVNTRANGQPDLPFIAPEIYAAVEMVEPIVNKAARCATTKQVAALAEEAWKILEALLSSQQQPVPQPQQSPSSSSGSGGGSQSPSQEPAPGQAPDSQSSSTGTPDNEPSQPCGGNDAQQPGAEGKTSGKEVHGAPEGESPQQCSGEEQAAPGNAAAGGNAQENAAGTPKSTAPQQQHKSMQNIGHEQGKNATASAPVDPGQHNIVPVNGIDDKQLQGILGDLGDAIANQVRNYADSNQSYRVWSTKYDRVMLANSASYQTHSERMASVMPHVSGVRQRLLQTLLAEPRARWRGDLEEGNVNPRALHRLVCPAAGRAGTPRVFRRRERVKKLRTAVTLLVDESSSMHGKQIVLAMQTALVFCEALSRLNIATSVIGFSTATRDPNLDDALAQTGLLISEIRARYRTIPLRHTVYKRFGEAFHKVSDRMDNMRTRSLTPLGESMLFAAKTLAERHEERKVLFVLTDGRPEVKLGSEDATFSHAKAAIKRIEKAGMDVALLGIMAPVVNALHRRSVVINRVDDLPRAAMRQLQSVLSK